MTLEDAIAEYNDAWNAHDLERIRALHEDGMIKRKDVYSDSVSILRQVGLL